MNSPAPTISVVIPTFNRARMLKRAITSALGQTRQDIEVLVVDDGSTDETSAVVATFGDPRIRYFRHEQLQGACAARNTGIGAARGEYIAFLDSDDEWLPHKLAQQVDALERSDLGKVGIITCGEKAIRSNGHKTVWLPRKRGWILEDLLLQSSIGCRTTNLVVRAQILKEHGIQFDTNLPARQDWDFVAQVARVSQMEIVREPLSLVHHHNEDRVWTPERAVSAGNYLHDKYKADLRSNPRAHRQFHLRTALTSIAGGDMAGARGQIRAALEAEPRSVLTRLWLLIAYLQRQGRKPSLPQRAGIKLLRPFTF